MMEFSSSQQATRAVIDLGTNSALLVVGRWGEDGQVELLRQEIRIPRIGEGMQKGGTIGEDSFQRAVQSLQELLKVAAELGLAVDQVQVVATAALRRASNGAEVGKRLSESLGCPLQILSGEEEAHLSHLAVAEGDPQTLAIDVGGGSTEVVWDGGGSFSSLDLGALTLTERFGAEGAIDPSTFDEAQAWTRAQFESLPSDLGAEHSAALIGGSAVNLACLVRGLEEFDHTQADRVWVTAVQILSLAEDLWLENLDQRRLRPIESERVSILPAGLLCLGLALESLGAEGGWTRTVGLSHGLLRQLLA